MALNRGLVMILIIPQLPRNLGLMERYAIAACHLPDRPVEAAEFLNLQMHNILRMREV